MGTYKVHFPFNWSSSNGAEYNAGGVADLTYIEVKLRQQEKHLSPILVTDSGIVIEVKLKQ